MIQTGASDAQYFQFHTGAFGFFCAKPDASIRETSLEFWKMGLSSTGKPLARVKKAGEPWCWMYNSQKIKPEIWCVVDSAGAVKYVWEGESSVNPDAPGSNPIETTLEQGGSIIPSGGSAVKIQFVNTDLVNSIQSNLDVAALPAWIENTIYQNAGTTPILLRNLFTKMQIEANLKPYASIHAVLPRIQPFNYTQLYMLLWLRAASMVLNNHSAKICIPLVKNWTVNVETGVIQP